MIFYEKITKTRTASLSHARKILEFNFIYSLLDVFCEQKKSKIQWSEEKGREYRRKQRALDIFKKFIKLALEGIVLYYNIK